MDVVTLSRIQFALNISFHYLFPPLSIGLGLCLILMEGCYLWTKNPVYETIAKFWVKIFALIFAVGVATGLVMVFAFGNNWAAFSRFVGDVFGSLLGAEGIFAFFLESGFLAILLFGWEKVSPTMHFISTIMVTLGAHFSGLWIVFANSWIQTPAGYKIVGEGTSKHAAIVNFWDVMFNPSSIDRFVHTILSAWLCGAFLVMSVSAYYIVKKRHLDFGKKSFKIGLWVATFAVIAQLFSGDSTARGVAHNQPIKLAAFEGVYHTTTPTPMWASGVVLPEEHKVVGISLPGLLSLLVYRKLDKAVPGLDQFPQDLWPNVPIVFQTYHGMVVIWGILALAVLLAWIAIWRKKLETRKWILWFLVFSVVFPEIATQFGWYSAEIGRQPWCVYNILKTHEGVSAILSPGQVLSSIILFACIYFLLFILFIYLLNQKIKKGPPEKVEETEYRDRFKEKEAIES